MNQLPVEITRQICSLLSTSDLKSVRLTRKALADIGAEFLLPEVHLVYKRHSIVRLKKISLHPIFSQHVKSLFYEGDRLDYYVNRWYWEEDGVEKSWRARMPERPPQGAPEVDTEAFRTQLRKWMGSPKHSYTKPELKNGWLKYEALYKEQDKIQDRLMDHREISRAIMRFSKLDTLRLSINHGLCKATPYLIKSYEGALVMPAGEFYLKPHEAPGYRQFQSLMMGAATPERRDIKALKKRGISLPDTLDERKKVTELRVLHAASVSWFIFHAVSDSVLAEQHRCLTHLQDLKLLLNTGKENIREGEELDKCAEALREKGKMRKWLTACRNLEKLHIEFNLMNSRHQATELRHIVGKYTWVNLREVTFGKFFAREDNLLNFFERHKSTLQCLTVNGLTIEGTGSWARVLKGIRDVIQWKKASVHGELLLKDRDEGQQTYVVCPDDGPGVLIYKIQDYLMRRSSINPLDTD